MSITATVDGTAYTGIDTITTGGKTIALTESGGGGSVGGLTEYNSVTVAGSSASSTGDLTIEHGLTKAPTIIICNINKVITTDDKGKCIAFCYCGITNNDGIYFGSYFQTNTNTGAIACAWGQKVDTDPSSVGYFKIDSTELKIKKPGANYNWDANETYTFKFYA